LGITSFQGPKSHETNDYNTDADKPFIPTEDFEVAVSVWRELTKLVRQSEFRY